MFRTLCLWAWRGKRLATALAALVLWGTLSYGEATTYREPIEVLGRMGGDEQAPGGALGGWGDRLVSADGLLFPLATDCRQAALVIPPRGDARGTTPSARVVVTAHLDSAREFRMFDWLGTGAVPFLLWGAIEPLLAAAGLALALWGARGAARAAAAAAAAGRGAAPSGPSGSKSRASEREAELKTAAQDILRAVGADKGSGPHAAAARSSLSARAGSAVLALLLLATPLMTLFFAFLLTNDHVVGVSDDLVAVATLEQLAFDLRALADAGVAAAQQPGAARDAGSAFLPEDVEIVLLATSSEESGLRGARAFVRDAIRAPGADGRGARAGAGGVGQDDGPDSTKWGRWPDRVSRLDASRVPTVGLALEHCFTSEITTISHEVGPNTTHDHGVNRAVQDAALASAVANRGARPATGFLLPFGASDATPLRRAGLATAVILCAEDRSILPANYHTKRDVLSFQSREKWETAIAALLDVTMRTVQSVADGSAGELELQHGRWTLGDAPMATRRATASQPENDDFVPDLCDGLPIDDGRNGDIEL